MQGSSLGLALGVLAEALAATGDYARAIAYVHEATALHEGGGTFVWLVLTLRCQGDVLRLAGKAKQASESYLRALEIGAPRQMRFYAAECLAGLAALLSEAGRHELALRLVGASRALRESTGAPTSKRGPDLGRVAAAATEQIGAEAAARAQDEGAAIDLPQLDEILDAVRRAVP
jgi:tetratricopeptide (TPR) repeat protein